jgi:hypothetical protein
MVVGAIPTPAPKCNRAVPLGTMTLGVKLRNSNSPQFMYSSGGLCIKTIRSLGSIKLFTACAVSLEDIMEKFKHILYFTFVLMPLFYINGLSVIIIDNLKIFNCQFAVDKFKTKKQIDKEKFAKFMNRVCK